MPTILLIHGIAQEQKSADLLEAQWLPALAGGLRNAGYGSQADRLLLARGSPGRIEVRMAFYGDLFLRPGAMGAADVAPSDDEGAEALADAWLQALAAHSADSRVQAYAQDAVLRLAARRDAPMGLGAALVSPAMRAFTQVPFASEAAFMTAAYLKRSVRQVSAYVNDPSVQVEVRGRVQALLNDDTRVIIAHSLGSVVAFEMAHRLQRPLELLLTLGSPLGLRRPIYERLAERGKFPPQVRRWLNLADPDDFVAAVPDLGPLYSEGMPPGSRFEQVTTVNNGASPHSAEYYLGKAEVGHAVAAALGGGA